MKKLLALIALPLLAICFLGLTACGEVLSTEPADESDANTASSLSSLRVSFIDVGKGDCILVQADDDAAVLIDTGYEKTAKNVLSYLQDQGIDHLDAVVLTHYDRDHVGGVGKIGKGIGIDAIYLPGYEGSDENYRSCVLAVEELGAPIQRVESEIVVAVGGARLNIYPSAIAYEPGADGGEGNDNDASLVTALSNGQDSYLFAGDIEKDGIDSYLEANHGKHDVLKMPHHGQRSSNTEDFIDNVRPKIAVITDSKKDSASKKVLKLLESNDVETYCTGSDGTVVVESDGTGSYSVATLG